MDAMSKKEKLARGSAVIKVMKVIPRPGRFLKSYVDPRKLPKKPKLGGPRGVLADMPHLDVKNAIYEFLPAAARVPGPRMGAGDVPEDPCDFKEEAIGVGIPDGDELLKRYGYREWIDSISPNNDNNIAEHFNIMLGLLMSMAMDSDNENFADIEAYPCVQFLRTIKTPDGEMPYNTAAFVTYIEYVAQKMLDEG